MQQTVPVTHAAFLDGRTSFKQAAREIVQQRTTYAVHRGSEVTVTSEPVDVGLFRSAAITQQRQPDQIRIELDIPSASLLPFTERYEPHYPTKLDADQKLLREPTAQDCTPQHLKLLVCTPLPDESAMICIGFPKAVLRFKHLRVNTLAENYVFYAMPSTMNELDQVAPEYTYDMFQAKFDAKRTDDRLQPIGTTMGDIPNSVVIEDGDTCDRCNETLGERGGMIPTGETYQGQAIVQLWCELCYAKKKAGWI